jgi:N-acetylglucosaminyldiphosphoundecaprenol N-acetyl-beta-D-mannosaminyltransferase
MKNNFLPTSKIGGITFSNLQFDSLVQVIEESVTNSSALHIHFVNAYTTSLTLNNQNLLKLLNCASSLNLSDGKGITWLSKIIDRKSKLRQLRGPSFFSNFLLESSIPHANHYFLGGTQNTLFTLVSKLENSGNLKIVGFESPPFRELTVLERNALLRRIESTKPDIVWVGLGTPKQDFEAEFIAKNLNVVAIAVGAAFDFYSGNVKESPSWVSSIGLEWLFRLVQEPKRLLPRYTLGFVNLLRVLFRNR